MSVNRKYLWCAGLLLAACLAPAGGFAAPYQIGDEAGMGGRRGGPPPEQQLEQMTKMFDLTADQQAKLKPILVDERKKMNAVRDDTTLDRRAMLTKIAQIRKDSNDKVRALLNSQQKQKFDNMLQTREAQRQNQIEQMQKQHSGEPEGQGGNNSGGSAPAPPPQK